MLVVLSPCHAVDVTFYGPVRVFNDDISNNITLSALRSWNAHTVQRRIILYADDRTACDWLHAHGFSEARCMVTCRHALKPGLNVSCMLDTSADIADTEVLCLLNSDITLPLGFGSIVDHLFAGVMFEHALVVGRRTDLRVTDMPPIFLESPAWAGTVAKIASSAGKLHGVTGIDYFIHTRRMWSRFEVPPFIVGAWKWDNFLLSRALSDPHTIVVDATAQIQAVHLQKGVVGKDPRHELRKFAPYNAELFRSHSKKLKVPGKHCALLDVSTHTNTNVAWSHFRQNSISTGRSTNADFVLRKDNVLVVKSKRHL